MALFSQTTELKLGVLWLHDIADSVVEGNAARETGGAIVVRGDAHLDMVSTAVTGNAAKRGGAIYLTTDSAINVDDSIIEGNLAEQIAGIRVESSSTLYMTNTFVVDNRATTGGVGGINFSQSSGRLVNVTLAGNTSVDDPGGIRFTSSLPDKTLTIVNSIMAFNGTIGMRCPEDMCDVTYSIIQDVITGTGNILADPLFVDQTAGDFHLMGSSPAVDTGTSEGAPAADFEGDPRHFGVVDMGADEYTFTASHHVYVPFIVK